MSVKWSLKKFEELSLDEFHDMIQLREKVFVVEQDCPYLEVDGKDKIAYHVVGSREGKVIATARIFASGDYFEEVAIGRVVVDPNERGNQFGVDLMKYSLEQIEKQFGQVPVRISAQTYLLKFYIDLGFQQVGEPYLEDNIPHINMLFNR